MISKRGFYGIIIPITLKITFGGIDIYISFISYVLVLVAGNCIMKQLLWCNAECKKQEHEAGGNTLYGFLTVQFLLPRCKLWNSFESNNLVKIVFRQRNTNRRFVY